MAMNGNQLGQEIFNAVKAATGNGSNGTYDPQVLALWQAIASAIVSHIQANANAVGTDSGSDSHNLNIT